MGPTYSLFRRGTKKYEKYFFACNFILIYNLIDFLETIAKLDAELVLKTEVVSNYNGHIKLLEEKIARYENASSQSSPPINAR
jgi:hypothetical protein